MYNTFSIFLIVVLHSKTNRTYNTSQTNNANASTPKTRSQQKKSSTQYQRRNYDALHISSIPVSITYVIPIVGEIYMEICLSRRIQ